jgi:hypothetical protein
VILNILEVMQRVQQTILENEPCNVDRSTTAEVQERNKLLAREQSGVCWWSVGDKSQCETIHLARTTVRVGPH